MAKKQKTLKEKKFFPKNRNLTNYPTHGSAVCKLEKDELEKELSSLRDTLARLQELIYAESKHKVLIILQGLDTSGKDGTVKHVFSSTNPQGVRVCSFKQPTEVEASHDFLWRIHRETPRSGEMVIFNRSHYEDFIVPYVHHKLSEKHLQQRLEDIINFEKMMVSEGVILFKFFLHISPKEQAKRIMERLDNPEKHWKFSISDLQEREHWDRYIEAYGTAIKATHSKNRPWDIIPADDKRLRDYLISTILTQRLKALKPRPHKMSDRVIKKVRNEALRMLGLKKTR